MFKFRKLFSLEHDVTPMIPSNQLPQHGSDSVTYRAIKTSSTDFNSNNNNSAAGSMGMSIGNNNNNNNNMVYSTTPTNNFINHQRNQSGNMNGGMNITITNPMKMNNNNNMNDQFKLGSSLNTGGYFDHDIDDNNNNNNKSNNTQNNNKTYQQINYTQSINLRIIGRDKNGTLIIARTSKVDGVLNTYIDSFDISKHEFTTILVYSGNVISATLSGDLNKSFLVFTVKLPEKILDGQTAIELYSSFIYEIKNKKVQTFTPLETSSHYPLMYHFLPALHDKSSFMLLLFQGDECYSVKVALKHDNESNLQIVVPNKKPNKTNIFKKCYWYQFDYHNQVLYSLQLKQRSNSTFSSSSSSSSNANQGMGSSGGGISGTESILRIWTMNGTKIVNTHDGIPLYLNVNDPSKVVTNIPFPLGAAKNNTSSPSSSSQAVQQNIHIVKLPHIGLCLCHQEESSPHSLSIRISIYLLHLKQKIKYSIPLNTMDDGWQSVSKTRVLFDAFGSLLVIYVPGYFFQYIDCAHDHDPTFGITLYSRDLSIPLVEQQNQDSSDILSTRSPPLPNKISTSVIPFYFSNGNISDKNNGGGNGGSGNDKTNHHGGNDKSSNPKNNRYLFDYSNGILYHYQFERESIKNLFETPMDAGSDVQAMHLSIIHLNDVELGTSLITSAAKNNLITIDLFKEYILACTFHALKSIQLENSIGNTQYFDPVYLHSLPISCAESIENHQPVRKLKDLEISAISTAIPTNLLAKKEENRKRLKSFDVSKSEILNKDGPSFSGFWRNFFGMDDDFASDNNSGINVGSSGSGGGIGSNGNANVSGVGSIGSNGNGFNNVNGNGSGGSTNSITKLKGLAKYEIDPHLFENYQEDPLRDISPYISLLTEFLYSVSQKENKERLNEWSNYFRHIQINIVNTLYKKIKICYGYASHGNNNTSGGASGSTVGNINASLDNAATTNNNNTGKTETTLTVREMKHNVRLVLFETMEKLYSAIEELYCPFPKDFYTQFTTIGFYCLQRSTFLQFLQRGIFVITASFVKVLKKEFPNVHELTIDQRNFINQIVLQLRDQDSVVEMLKSDLSNTNIIVEHLISLATQSIHPKSSLDPMMIDQSTDYQDAKFIPLFCLQDFLKSLAQCTPNINLSSTSSNNLLGVVQPTPPISMSSPNKFYTPPTSPVRGSTTSLAQQQQFQQQFQQSNYNNQPFSCSPVNSNFMSNSNSNLNQYNGMISGGNNSNYNGGSNNSNGNNSNGNIGNIIGNANLNPIFVNRNHILRAYHFLNQNSDRILEEIFKNINNCNKIEDSIN